MRRTRPLALLLALVLALGACGGEEGSESGEEAAGACEEVSAPEPKQVDLRRPRDLTPEPRRSSVRFVTSCGEFTVELAVDRAPKTAASIQYLVENGVYDGTTFHRIAPGFVIQGGDPQLDGSGGPGYSVVEPPPPNLVYERGLVAMAKTEVEQPGTSGSQFFVVTAPADAGLSPEFALAGEVTDGFEVVELIEQQATQGDGPPVQPIVIERASFTGGQ